MYFKFHDSCRSEYLMKYFSERMNFVKKNLHFLFTMQEWSDPMSNGMNIQRYVFT